ncbi:MAG TPA: FAD:protein FMN transferase [Candidatus Saccharimonadales bacterium]|nr:FAD:protein FMN transferase [Candidatus Saccharimonadales bacterium]
MPSTKSSSKPKHSFGFEAIGTAWSIDIEGEVDVALEAEIIERIEIFDKTYSRFRPDSLITKMSKHAGTYELPKDASPLLAFYRRLYDATNGAVTPLIGSVMEQAGYDASYSLQPKRLQQPPAWQDILEIADDTMHLKQPAVLDLGAAGKGYLVDIVSAIIQKYEVTSFCVDAGGDMRYYTTRNQALRVGLEHPDDPTQIIGVAELGNQSLCGSAGNRRKWATYHHIIDPRTLESPRHNKATWVVAPTAMEADGLTTALFFAPPEKLHEFNFEYVIVHANNSAHISPNFPGQLFAS